MFVCMYCLCWNDTVCTFNKQISRGAVKEQTRLSRSSDIIPVLQATVICLRGSLKAGPATNVSNILLNLCHEELRQF